MKEIALLYLNVTNLGDIVIKDTAKFLLKKAIKETNKKINITEYDIGDIKKNNIKISRKREFINKIITVIIKILNTITFSKFKNTKLFYKLSYIQSKQYLFIKYRVLKKFEINKPNIIFFAGGGLIKYHAQEFHMIINQITKYADKKNISVVFNAVGIEGYNIKDARCKILKNAINRKCVLAISTRDNIESLNENYITNKKIKTKQVADPALWSKECYKIRKKESNTIGLGVIRPEIFKDYLYDVKEDELLKLFSEIITKLKKLKYNVKLFTNGAKKDMDFIYKLKEYMKNEKNFDEMIIARPTTSEELVKNISSFKTTLGTRLHSNIISYSLDIPTVSIVWNIKQIYFSQINNIEEFFITKKDFNSNYIVNKLLSADKQNKLNEKYKNTAYIYIKNIIKQI